MKVVKESGNKPDDISTPTKEHDDEQETINGTELEPL